MGSYLFSVVLTVHVLVGVAVIGLVLMQHGKGADAGAAFGGGGGGGGGASGSVFGSSGSANFMSRTTALLAATFFATSLGLAYISSNATNLNTSVMEGATPSAVPAAVEAERSVEPPPVDDSKARDIPK